MLFLLVYSSESPTAPCQGRILDLCCSLSPKLCQNLPVSTCKTLFLAVGLSWMPRHFCIVTEHRTVLPELVLFHQIHLTAAHLLPLWMVSSPDSKTCRNAEGLNELPNFKQTLVQVAKSPSASSKAPQSYSLCEIKTRGRQRAI